MKKRVFSTLFLAVLLFWQMVSNLAATEVEAPDTYSLKEVVVTASRSEQPLSQISSNITIIPRKELVTSAARTIGEFLAEKNLGHIQMYPGALTSIGIRGFRTDTHGNDLQSHLLILLDGRRAGTGNLAKLLKANVERIEIIRGPGAVQYGSAGMGGVINIITTRGTDNSLTMAGGGGNFGLAEASVGATAAKAGFDFAGTFTARTWNDYEDGAGNRYHNTDIDHESAASINTGFKFMEGNRIGAIFTYYKADDAGMPGYLSKNDLDDYTDKRHWSLDLRYDGQNQDGHIKWLVRGFIGEDDDEWTTPPGSDPDGWDAWSNGETSINYTDQYGAQAQVTGSFDRFTVTGGIDWIKYDISASWDPKDSEYDNPALFLLSSMDIFEDRLTLTFGMRYDWYSVEINDPNDNQEDEENFTPMAGLAWMVTEDLKFRAQYAQGFMMPSAWQLAGYSASFWGITKGNPDLDPEKSHTYEAGIDYSHGGAYASLTYFHTDFNDKIESIYLPDGTQTYDNISDATIEGLEIAASYDIGQCLDLSWEIRPYLNLTWLTKYEDDETDEDLLYTSAVHLSSGISLSDGERFTARFNLAYTSDQDIQDWESGTGNVVNMDGFTVVDITAEYLMLRTAKYGDFTIRGEIKNLFDEDYAYVKGYPMPGVNFYLGMRWDY